jgi:shikimate kinase
VARSIEKLKSCLQFRSLVLIGLMGAGKSSIGKRLASALNVPFTDADNEIEKAAGKTITDIFEEDGEDYFRDGEYRVILRLLRDRGQVLARGGGAFMRAETREQIAKDGISIWLKADLDLLMSRVSRRDTRPLLRRKNPAGIMAKLIEERYPVYAQADITIVSRDAPHEEIVNEIIEAVAACEKCKK